jgi:CRP-like cAMP-binding protein
MSDCAIHLLIRKLDHLSALSSEEQAAVQEAAGPVRQYGTHQCVVREFDTGGDIAVVVSGLACQHRTLPDGRRQIVGYSVPGDICDGRIFISTHADWTISTMMPTTIVMLSRADLDDAISSHPKIARSLWCNTMLQQSIERQWLFNLGQLTALERLAHLFCELHMRSRSTAKESATWCELPFTQSELADVVALSTVHVNRSMKELRRLGLATVTRKVMTIHNLDGLRALAMFDTHYLELGCNLPLGKRSDSRSIVPAVGSAGSMRSQSQVYSDRSQNRC